MGKYASLFVEYGCGNRFYFEPGDVVPEYCPLEDCDTKKGGVFEDEDGLSSTEDLAQDCPECGLNDQTNRQGQTVRWQTRLVVAERYLCQPPEDCRHSWEVDTYGEGIYQDGGGS